jgi:hypothetical protein
MLKIHDKSMLKMHGKKGFVVLIALAFCFSTEDASLLNRSVKYQQSIKRWNTVSLVRHVTT